MKLHTEDLNSVITPHNCTPRHTIRHREPHILPTFANAASDMDNLDDVSEIESYIDIVTFNNNKVVNC